MTFDFHDDALREYLEGGLWYEEQRHRLGVDFTETVEAAISLILENPNRYQAVGEGIHIFRVKRFPYHIYYKFHEERQHVPGPCRHALQETAGLLEI